jgi:hypothetical protein
VDRLIALVALRLKLELRSYLRARESLIGVLLAVPGLLIFSTVTAVFLWFGLRFLSSQGSELAALSLIGTAIGFLWCLSPLTTGIAFTESHDLARLIHFPVRPAVFVLSSLLANFAQPMVWSQAPAVLILVAASARSALGFIPAVVGVGLFVTLVLAGSQLAGLLLHAIARRRRWHDLALVGSLLLTFALSSLPLLLILGGGRVILPVLRTLLKDEVLALSPFAWGLRAAALGGRGDFAGFALYGALGCAAVVLVIASMGWLVGIVYRGELVIGPASLSGAQRPVRSPLPGTVGALIEKDLRLAWREPALKTTLVLGLVGPFIFLLFLSQTGALGASESALLYLAVFLGLGSVGGNTFGLERRGVMLLLGFPTPRVRILFAKNVTALIFRLPGLLVLTIGGVMIAPLAYFPAFITITLVTLATSLGVDNFVSILFPIPAPGPRNNPYARTSGGRGLGFAVLTLALAGGALLLASPFIFLAWLPHMLGLRSLWWASLPLAVVGSGAVYGLLVGGAAHMLARREPELLERMLGES